MYDISLVSTIVVTLVFLLWSDSFVHTCYILTLSPIGNINFAELSFLINFIPEVSTSGTCFAASLHFARHFVL